MSQEEHPPSGSFGPYKLLFEDTMKEVKYLRRDLNNHQVAMASFVGKVVGGAIVGSIAASILTTVIMNAI